jgi:hypothetical protein
MIGILIFILALSILYILSRIFIHKLFIALYRLTRSRERAAGVLGWIFLPGTFIHEVSHLIAALFLLVPVGRINLLAETEEEGIKLGSVQIGKTDFVRASIIGLAPVIIGGGGILWAISFSLTHGYLGNPWVIIGLIYAIFQVTHTMFSSGSDLNAVLELAVFLTVISLALILFKIYGPFAYIYQQMNLAGPVIQEFSYFLAIPICVELIFLGIFTSSRS